DLVMRNEKQIADGRLHHLPQEIPGAGAGDGDDRSFRVAHLLADALQQVADGGRREGEVAILLAVLNGRFDDLFEGGVEHIGGQIAGRIEIRLDDVAAQRLAAYSVRSTAFLVVTASSPRASRMVTASRIETRSRSRFCKVRWT